MSRAEERSLRGYPLIGVFYHARRDPPGFLLAAARRYGDVVTMRFGWRRLCLVAHPDGIKHVLHDTRGVYRKAPAAARVDALFGHSLTSIDGDRWQRQRRRMQAAFHPKRQDHVLPVVVQATAEMLERWQQIADAAGTVDPLDEMTTLTRTIILRALFGDVAAADFATVSAALDVVVNHVDRSLWSPLARLALSTVRRRRFQRAVGILDDFVARMITRVRHAAPCPESLVAALADARDSVGGARMSETELRHETKAILIAGHTTLASALTWIWYVLAADDRTADCLCQEVDAVIGDRVLSAEMLQKLQYTRMVVAEVLRLYPPTWMTARTLQEDDEIDGHPVPAGTIVIVSPFVTQRHPSFWPDPERFDPERFLPERVAARPPFAYLPFGRGPRSCVGSGLGLLEMEVVVALVAQRYRLSRVGGTPLGFAPGITLRPAPRLPLALHLRHDNATPTAASSGPCRRVDQP